MILGLDAGMSAKNATGVALANPTLKRIVGAELIRRNPKLSGLAAHYDIAARAVAWAKSKCPAHEPISVLVAEWPVAYPPGGGRSSVNPNTSLMPLCGIVGAVSGMLPGVRRIEYSPRDWKGTIDGDTFVRTWIEPELTWDERRIYDAVSPASLRHNAADAIGLILKTLGRLDRKRIVHTEPRGTP